MELGFSEFSKSHLKGKRVLLLQVEIMPGTVLLWGYPLPALEQGWGSQLSPLCLGSGNKPSKCPGRQTVSPLRKLSCLNFPRRPMERAAHCLPHNNSCWVGLGSFPLSFHGERFVGWGEVPTVTPQSDAAAPARTVSIWVLSSLPPSGALLFLGQTPIIWWTFGMFPHFDYCE